MATTAANEHSANVAFYRSEVGLSNLVARLPTIATRALQR